MRCFMLTVSADNSYFFNDKIICDWSISYLTFKIRLYLWQPLHEFAYCVIFVVFFNYFLKYSISVRWRAKEANFGSFCSIFYPFSNGDWVKLIGVQIKKLQLFKNWKNDILGQKCNSGKFLFYSIRVPMHRLRYIYTKGP